MNDDQIDDLKQFIDSKISQSEQRVTTELEEKFNVINLKMDDSFASIGEAIEEIHKQLDDRDIEVDKRFTKLEQQAA